MADKQKLDANKKTGVNLNRYETDVTGVSMKTLEAGLWWTKNRGILKNILIIFLLSVSILSWGYTLYGYGYYLLVGMNADEQMVKNLAQSTMVGQAYLDQLKAKNLILSPVGYLALDGKYDLYLQATNPNARWWAAFDYCFTRSAGEKICGKDFLLPGEKKYILSLNQSFNASPNDLKFALTDIVWQKINNHVISNWPQYQADHLNIAVEDQLFTPAKSNAVSEKIALNTLTFKLANNSAYSFYEVPLTIILTSGNRIVYLDRYTISNFISREKRRAEITWPGTISDVTGINITPDLNILDQGAYRQPQ
ncbi:MAG: hypothetical protein PHE24_01845 [Patescibacteria group bacterium]|nr:hypothetical protein [Patescibacteria group bacterium]